MAFEPLQTDEKIEPSSVKKRDWDDQMLFGCGGFLVAAVAGYMLSIWPFFVWQQGEQLRILGICVAAGLIPPLIVGGILSRKYGLPGACGLIGGALCTAIFLYLRIQQAFIEAAAQRVPTPDYPRSVMAVLPLAYVLISVLVGYYTLKPGEFDDRDA